MPSIGQLLRGSDREFFDLFERAGANAVRAATLLDELLAGFPETQLLAATSWSASRRATSITHEIVKRLNQTSSRRSTARTSAGSTSAIDDIVDYIEEAADYLGLYRIEAPMAQAQELAQVLLEATGQIAGRSRSCATSRASAATGSRSTGSRTRATGSCASAVASLFEDGIDPMVVIRWKDIFELLEDAIDATERAAHILEGIVIKNA